MPLTRALMASYTFKYNIKTLVHNIFIYIIVLDFLRLDSNFLSFLKHNTLLEKTGHTDLDACHLLVV